MNKLLRATLNERIASEKLFKEKEPYMTLDIPESCFKIKSQELVLK